MSQLEQWEIQLRWKNRPEQRSQDCILQFVKSSIFSTQLINPSLWMFSYLIQAEQSQGITVSEKKLAGSIESVVGPVGAAVTS
ncbi:hypothetical protein [Peribacillus simplex]|uniref:hypothetical protein n=1 Tax=Peribacillus simplex TaxID=1478 RepID=UPI003D2E8D45